jgi:hypothetical protein
MHELKEIAGAGSDVVGLIGMPTGNSQRARAEIRGQIISLGLRYWSSASAGAPVWFCWCSNLDTPGKTSACSLPLAERRSGQVRADDLWSR